jgi:hypothetical protein
MERGGGDAMRLTSVTSAPPLAVLATFCILVTGCSPHSQGEVTGVVRGYGGPLTPELPSGFYTGQPLPAQEIAFEDTSGMLTTATANADGYYSVSLTPGAYTLLCGTNPLVNVVAGTTVTLDCDFHFG